MSGNIPGTGGIALPGAYSIVETQSRGASVPGGTRIASFIGEGSKSEVIVSSALGGGKDGLNSTYTSVSGADGRHFLLSSAPVITNRTTLFKNGIPLVGLEDLISSSSFSNAYDYRIDIATGKIEMQKAHLVDQGGSFYSASTLNVGAGSIQNLTIADVNAPPETWTIKCVSVQRDNSGDPVALTAKFIASGSVSGTKLDANGNPVIWVANNTIVSNTVLSFSILEGATVLREGDSFTVKVNSGVLNRNDSLTASYIPTATLNDPEFLQSTEDIVRKHGAASLDNNLALGCQLAFSNGAPGIMCVQAAPSMPRRTSYVLEEDGVNALSSVDADFIFPLPLGVTPNLDSNIHFFVTDLTTNVETQILPNKYPFYTLDTGGHPTTHAFIIDNTAAPSGNSYAYTVNQAIATINSGFDGYVTKNPATVGGHVDGYGIFNSSIAFDSSYVGLTLKVIDATHTLNKGSFVVYAVTDGKLYIHQGTLTDNFTTESNMRYEVLDSSQTSDYVVINHNVVPDGNKLRVTIVDTKDAAFYDAGWLNALTSLETQEIDILVTLPKQTISVVFQNALNHCKTMSSVKNRKERVLFLGAINGLIPANLTGAKQAAVEDIGVLEGIQGETVADVLAGSTEDLTNYSVSDGFGNTFRAVYFYPDQIVVQSGTDNVLIDGFYIAAAAAGYLSGVTNVAIPLTNKTLAGFTILRNKQFSPLVLEQLAQAGVTTLQPVQGGGRVVWGLTTTQSGFVEEQEISIVFIRDRIAKSMRLGFAGFIGMAEDDTTVAALSARAQSLLQSFISQGLATAYKDLLVQRDSVDPRQWNVTVRVQPTYGITWILIKVGLGLL